MHNITPLNPNDKGPEVSNLQEALLFLIKKGTLPLDAVLLGLFNLNWTKEYSVHTYSDVTKALVALFQRLNTLPETGIVDQATADKLNVGLNNTSAVDETQSFTIAKVVPVIKRGDTGAAVANLQQVLHIIINQNLIWTPDDPDNPPLEEVKEDVAKLLTELKDAAFRETTEHFVKLFQEKFSLPVQTGVVEENTAAKLNDLLLGLGIDIPKDMPFYIVQKITPTIKIGDTGAVVANLQKAILDLVRKNMIWALDDPGRPNPDEFQKGIDAVNAELNNAGFGQATESYIKQIQTKNHFDVAPGVVEEKTASKMNEWLKALGLLVEPDQPDIPGDNPNIFTVSGSVKDSLGNPQAGLTVIAYDKDLRNEQPLGKTATDNSGFYEIKYTDGLFQRAEKERADLVVRVFDKHDNLLAESPIEKNAHVDSTINFILYIVPPDEWTSIFQTITPLLEGQGDGGLALKTWELTQTDIRFIADETGISIENLALWVEAEKTANSNNLIEVGVFDDLTDSKLFYGWFRTGLPHSFSLLIAQSTAILLSNLLQAVSQNYIPAIQDKWIEQLRDIFDKRRREEVLKPAEKGGPASLGDLFSAVSDKWFTPDYRVQVAQILETTNHNDASFIKKVENIGLEEKQALQVRQAIQLGEITLQHLPMVKALLPIVETDPTGSLENLAGVYFGQWLEMAYENGTPANSIITPHQYAETLVLAVEAEIPTVVLGTMLKNESIVFDPDEFSGVQSTIAEHKTFDIAKDDIDAVLGDKDISVKTISGLKKLQHLRRLDANWKEIEVLVNLGIHSAKKITDYDNAQFITILADHIPAERLNVIYNRASALKAASIGLLAYLQPLMYGTSAAVMGTHRNLANLKETIDNSATLRKLFGALEQCACEDCLSVLSPAAYLADLLRFVDASPTASDELQQRRPDIYDSELSCDNATIELPQIDLAIEILENAVALPYDVLLPTIPVTPAITAGNWPPLRTELPGSELVDGHPIGALVQGAIEETVVEKPGSLTAYNSGNFNHLIPAFYDEVNEEVRKFKFDYTRWTVRDVYRTWTIESREEIFGYSDNGNAKPFAKTNLYTKLIALANGEILQELKDEIIGILPSISYGLPVTTEFNAPREMTGSTEAYTVWEIDIVQKGKISASAIQHGNYTVGTFKLTDNDGNNEFSRTGFGNYFEYFIGELNGLHLTEDLINILTSHHTSTASTGKFLEVVSLGFLSWQYSASTSISLIYRPAAITITGLTYQTTAANRDLFARPQNRNPRAYKILSINAEFPWSLPYDFSLAETRETLNVTGVPRLSLLEYTTGSADLYTSNTIAQERLGISSAEWDLITNQISVDINGHAPPGFYEIWGLDGSGIQTLRDSFIDLDITAAPFGTDGLLTRVSIVLDQSRLHFSDLEGLLESRFINPNDVNIQIEGSCQPSNMRFSVADENTLASLLVRLHRFVRLWRITGWEIYELDLAIQAEGIGGGKIDEIALVQIANLGLIKERLHLPIEVLVTMIGGFSDNPYSQIVNDETKQIIPLYDRLFQNRQLIDPPLEKLAYTAGISNPDLTDSIRGAIASAVGIRQSDFADLRNTAAIDTSFRPILDGGAANKNKLLQWVFRNVMLTKTLGLSLINYDIAWNLFPGDHFLTPGYLIKFLDEIAFVNKSGFAWGELEYILLNSDTDELTTRLTNQQAAEILTGLQSQLEQLRTPEPIQTSETFSLTPDDLVSPPFPSTPASSELRFQSHWKLERSDQIWTVQEPGQPGKLTGKGLELLARIDVLAQQSNLTGNTIVEALKTSFVSRSQAPEFNLGPSGNPILVNNLTEDHLDRLEVFAYLLKSSKLSIQDLSLFLDVFAKPFNWDISKIIKLGPGVLKLRERLQLPLNIIANWWGTIADPGKGMRLAEAFGVGIADMERLFMIYKLEYPGADAWESPSSLIQFLDAIIFLKQRTDLVIKYLSQAISLETEVVATCLWEYLHTPEITPRLGIQHLMVGNYNGLIPDTAHAITADDRLLNSIEYSILLRLHKTALLFMGWKINTSQFYWIGQVSADESTRFKGLIFDTLPDKVGTAAQIEALVPGWKRSTELYNLVHAEKWAEKLLTKYLDVVNIATTDNDRVSQIKQILADSFKLSIDTVNVCVNRIQLNNIGQLLDPLELQRLIDLLGILQRLGIDHSILSAIVAVAPGIETSDLSRTLLRSRFGDTGWMDALQKVTNKMRIQQRDKLVDFLLAREGLHDANALYVHYLIDVEMMPCMNTTRLLQSTASVQLFIQRCFFNLEPGISPDSISRDRWKWMQSFRVWEANRKVFLYPENWLFPEVRDDQTETFKTYQSALTQGEPSDENAKRALLQYLDDLTDIGQISTLSMYGHVEQDGSLALYLIGRLSNSANVYFWRKCTNIGHTGTRWTGWERIDLELSINHIIPFIFEGDFHVAWPLINTITKDNKDDYYEIQMAWAKKTTTGWTKRKTSKTKLPYLVKKPVNKEIEEILHLELLRASAGANYFTIAIYAQVAIEQPPPPVHPDCSAKIIAGTRVNSSMVFWSLDNSVENAYILYKVQDEPGRALLSGEYSLAITGIKKDTLMNTVSPFTVGRTDLIPFMVTDIIQIIENFKKSQELAAQVALTLLLAAPLLAITVASIIPDPTVVALATIPILSVTLPLILVAYPDLAKEIDSYLNADVFRITGSSDDYHFINAAEIAIPTDRMISFTKAIAPDTRKTIGIRAYFLDKMVDLPFNNNLPDGVTCKTSLTIQMNVKFKDIEDANFTEPEGPLQMQAIGNFKLNPGSVEEWEPALKDVATGKPQVLKPEINARFWSDGYQQTSSGNLLGLRSGLAEKTWFTRAKFPDGSSISTSVYLEEGDRRIILTDTGFFPAGFSESILYKNWGIASLDNLFNLSSQSKIKTGWFNVDFKTTWFGDNRDPKDPRDNNSLGFDLSMPNASYNWEVFYHAPIAAALFLSRQHRFEDARKWFHLVFDPTTNDPGTGQERFWRFLPFHNAQIPATITQLLEALSKPEASDSKTDVQDQIAAWLNDPFNPFAVARLRTGAFEWYTVISYIKNLIDWGDQLFRRDTRESINEATLLYVMGAQILGPRPEKIRHRDPVTNQPLSYRMINMMEGGTGDYDFSNAWISLADNPLIQAWAALLQMLDKQGIINNSQSTSKELDRIASIASLYFCVPPNEKISELWDLVEDRLFKIRNCQNMDGVTRNLSLYEPPIDPELIIRAKAAGLDLADVLDDLSAPLPYYRFQMMLQKANEFCNEVKSLGAAILSAIEKKESEHIGLLRSSQEIAMLQLIQTVKEEQIKEAQANIDSLQKTRNNTLDRFVFLQRQLGQNKITQDLTGVPIVEQSLMLQVQENGTPDGFSSLALIQSEIDQIRNMELSNLFSIIAGVNRFSAGVTHLIGLYPPAKDYAEASGFALSAMGDGFGTLAGYMSFLEHRSSQMSAWQRRRDDWVQQSKMTAEEIRQIDKQIIALEIRKSIAEKELANHQTQIENASNIDDYLRALKFSGESLYGWMESQLAGLFFSAYQMAYDLSKKAEHAYRNEIGEPISSFVQFGHWDNLRKGLLSGEKLSLDLRRMEWAYLDSNKRELEITKHISLRQLDAGQIQSLRTTGRCDFNIPEWIFDMDFPGHYFRRIKSVSVSIPCVVGPYTGVPGTLTLLSSKVRNKAIMQTDYANDANFLSSYISIQSIATSTAQNDNGLFEFNLRDERYLPFESAGAISTWRFELPMGFPAFDYDTISDLVLHMRYTARNSGSLADKAIETAKAVMKAQSGSQHLLLDLRRDFATAWAHMKAGTGNPWPITITLDNSWFPALFKGGTKILAGGRLWLKGDTGWASNPVIIPATQTIPASGTVELPIADLGSSPFEAVLILDYSVNVP